MFNKLCLMGRMYLLQISVGQVLPVIFDRSPFRLPSRDRPDPLWDTLQL